MAGNKPPKRLRVKEAKVSRSTGGTLAIFIFLLVVGVVFMLPLYLSVINAFKPIEEIMVYPPKWYVSRPVMSNFVTLNRLATSFWVPLSRYVFNSAFVAMVATFLQIMLSSMAAYPLAKLNFVGKKFLNKLIEWALLFGGGVSAFPVYLVMSQLHLINTYWALILPVVASTMNLFLIRQSMSQMENAVLEAARIDGAGELKIWWNIVMPNMKPAWITAMIFAFQGIWASTGGIYIYDESYKMLPSVMQQIAGGGIARTGATAAASLVMMLPPIVLFVVSQNFVIDTMGNSGMK
ncbi:MAG: carbohydrate ABC transporter permease [Oscillospiraceae bacterium]|nr:carbohydrate ABC transporter permease [Oscillospiraceae bacterium]